MNANKQVKTAYAYLRVGTCQQNMSGVSIQTQKEEVKAYCRHNNIRLIDVFIDCPASANNFNRSGFVKMLGRNVVKPVDYIVATNVDRISRNIREYVNLKNQLFKLGTQFEFPNAPTIPLFEELVEATDLFYSMERKRKCDCDCNCRNR